MIIYLPSENETHGMGVKLANFIQENNASLEIHLIGDLGAGKTTLARGLIEGMGWRNAVKSPTYTLCEEYDLDNFFIIHCDLYRLNTLEDLELLDLDRQIFKTKILLVEWPDRLPLVRNPDIEMRLIHCDKGRKIECNVLSEHSELKESFL